MAEVQNVEEMPLPPLVEFQEAMKKRELFIKFIDKIVECIAYWILQHGDIKSASGHARLRDRLAVQYPLLRDDSLRVL